MAPPGDNSSVTSGFEGFPEAVQIRRPPAPPPMPPVKTVPAGSVPKDAEPARISTPSGGDSNLVLVPVTVKMPTGG
jgi:hypothetical protein